MGENGRMLIPFPVTRSFLGWWLEPSELLGLDGIHSKTNATSIPFFRKSRRPDDNRLSGSDPRPSSAFFPRRFRPKIRQSPPIAGNEPGRRRALRENRRVDQTQPVRIEGLFEERPRGKGDRARMCVSSRIPRTSLCLSALLFLFHWARLGFGDSEGRRKRVDATIRRRAGGSDIVIRTSSRLAGAIGSLIWNGKEFIDRADHGRELQSACSFDEGVPAEFWPEAYNPTEAGTRADGEGPNSSSRSLRIQARGDTLETVAQAAFWLAPGKKSSGRKAKTDRILSNHHICETRADRSARSAACRRFSGGTPCFAANPRQGSARGNTPSG